MSNSSGWHALQSTRLLSLWNSLGKNTEEGCHSLLQGIVPTQGSNLGLLHCRWILYHLSHQKKKKKKEVAQLCPTLCDPTDCSLLGSSIHGIFQARVLEWVAISFSRESYQPRDRTQVSHIAGRFLTVWVIREAPKVRKPLDESLS